MAISSNMLPLGTQAPDFNLKDITSNQQISLSSFKDKKALLVMFICRHCPYVKHVQIELAQIGRDYQGKNIAIVAISSNDPSAYPEDAPESLKKQAEEIGFTFPYLFDETQEVAKAYQAACTPDFFLFDGNRKLVYKRSLKTSFESRAYKLVYRGQLDESRPGNNIPVTGKDVREAIEAVLNDKEVNPDQKPSIGCSINFRGLKVHGFLSKFTSASYASSAEDCNLASSSSPALRERGFDEAVIKWKES